MPFLRNLGTYIEPAVAQTTPANPTAPASTSATFVMQGLGALITPTSPSGNILAILGGTIKATGTTTADGIELQMYYGAVVPGTSPPANTAAIPAGAVALGKPILCGTGATVGSSGGGAYWPFAAFGLALGLTVGQQYWFDFGAYSLTDASNFEVVNPNIVLANIG